MKGFVRILEAIIASLILLSSLSYFFTISSSNDWNLALLQADVQDALVSMDKTVLQIYLKDNDKVAIESTLRSLLSDTVDFSTTVEGLPNADIFIGCNCTAQEVDDLKQDILRLNPDDTISFKDRNITIRVKNESINNIDPRTTILFLFNYEDLTPNRPFLDPFLARGGTVFMLAQLEGNTIDQTTKEIFGLEEQNPASSTLAIFYDTLSPENVSSTIFDYFLSIAGDPSEDFGRFSPDKIKADDRTVAVNKIPLSLKRDSFAKVNYNITANGRGRAVWVGNYPYTTGLTDPVANNTNKLVTALVLWGSGESYILDPVKKVLPDTFYEYRYIGVLNRTNGTEPFAIKLKVWHIFY